MTSASSTAIMANHVQMAVLTLKKEIAIESKKMAGVVNPRIKKNRIVAGSWGSSSSLPFALAMNPSRLVAINTDALMLNCGFLQYTCFAEVERIDAKAS
jgi:hypothetical protein